jgi:hypothetical protein
MRMCKSLLLTSFDNFALGHFRHEDVVEDAIQADSTQEGMITKVEEMIVTISWAEKQVAV